MIFKVGDIVCLKNYKGFISSTPESLAKWARANKQNVFCVRKVSYKEHEDEHFYWVSNRLDLPRELMGVIDETVNPSYLFGKELVMYQKDWD